VPGELASPLSTAVVHITVTSVKLCLLLNEVNCFCVVWNDKLFNVFCVSKRFCVSFH